MKLLSNLILLCAFLHNCYANVTLADENYDPYFSKFLDNLVEKSGLDGTNYTLPAFECDLKPISCIVNPDGDVLWTVREQLYEENLKYTSEYAQTIDGCLTTYAEDETEFNKCMVTVRERMTQWLDDEFDNKFTKELKNNCTLISDNCK